MKRPKVIELWNDAVMVTPRDVDWSTGYGETWDMFEAARCEECNKRILVGSGGDDKHCNLVEGSTCEGHVPQVEGPMINYFYPLPSLRFDRAEAARRIVDLPLCLVEFTNTEEIGLALTGGGMDLSWEICEAYMRLGYLPPMHFRLPAMCGRGVTAKDRWIVRGYKRSCKIAALWARSNAKHADEAIAFGMKHEAEVRTRREAGAKS